MAEVRDDVSVGTMAFPSTPADACWSISIVPTVEGEASNNNEWAVAIAAMLIIVWFWFRRKQQG